jgi:hypothetical protein
VRNNVPTLRSVLASISFNFFACLLVYSNGSLAYTLDIQSYRLSGTELKESSFGVIPASNPHDQFIPILKRRGKDLWSRCIPLITFQIGQVDITDNIGLLQSVDHAQIDSHNTRKPTANGKGQPNICNFQFPNRDHRPSFQEFRPRYDQFQFNPIAGCLA